MNNDTAVGTSGFIKEQKKAVKQYIIDLLHKKPKKRAPRPRDWIKDENYVLDWGGQFRNDTSWDHEKKMNNKMVLESCSKLKQKPKIKPTPSKSKGLFQSARFKKHKNAVHLLSHHKKSPKVLAAQRLDQTNSFLDSNAMENSSWLDTGANFDIAYVNEDAGFTLPPPMHPYNSSSSKPMMEGELRVIDSEGIDEPKYSDSFEEIPGAVESNAYSADFESVPEQHSLEPSAQHSSPRMPLCTGSYEMRTLPIKSDCFVPNSIPIQVPEESITSEMRLSNPLLYEISEYSPTELSLMLKALGYSEYRQAIVERNITGHMFLYSDEIDLHHAGISYRPHRLKLLGFINRIIERNYDAEHFGTRTGKTTKMTSTQRKAQYIRKVANGFTATSRGDGANELLVSNVDPERNNRKPPPLPLTSPPKLNFTQLNRQKMRMQIKLKQKEMELAAAESADDDMMHYHSSSDSERETYATRRKREKMQQREHFGKQIFEFDKKTLHNRNNCHETLDTIAHSPYANKYYIESPYKTTLVNRTLAELVDANEGHSGENLPDDFAVEEADEYWPMQQSPMKQVVCQPTTAVSSKHSPNINKINSVNDMAPVSPVSRYPESNAEITRQLERDPTKVLSPFEERMLAKNIMRQQRASRVIQRCWRKYGLFKVMGAIKEIVKNGKQKRAALRLQSFVRSFIRHRAFLKKYRRKQEDLLIENAHRAEERRRNSTIYLQKSIRCFLGVVTYKRLRKAHGIIACAWRCVLARRFVRLLKEQTFERLEQGRMFAEGNAMIVEEHLSQVTNAVHRLERVTSTTVDTVLRQVHLDMEKLYKEARLYRSAFRQRQVSAILRTNCDDSDLSGSDDEYPSAGVSQDMSVSADKSKDVRSSSIGGGEMTQLVEDDEYDNTDFEGVDEENTEEVCDNAIVRDVTESVSNEEKVTVCQETMGVAEQVDGCVDVISPSGVKTVECEEETRILSEGEIESVVVGGMAAPLVKETEIAHTISKLSSQLNSFSWQASFVEKLLCDCHSRESGHVLRNETNLCASPRGNSNQNANNGYISVFARQYLSISVMVAMENIMHHRLGRPRFQVTSDEVMEYVNSAFDNTSNMGLNSGSSVANSVKSVESECGSLIGDNGDLDESDGKSTGHSYTHSDPTANTSNRVEFDEVVAPASASIAVDMCFNITLADAVVVDRSQELPNRNALSIHQADCADAAVSETEKALSTEEDVPLRGMGSKKLSLGYHSSVADDAEQDMNDLSDANDVGGFGGDTSGTESQEILAVEAVSEGPMFRKGFPAKFQRRIPAKMRKTEVGGTPTTSPLRNSNLSPAQQQSETEAEIVNTYDTTRDMYNNPLNALRKSPIVTPVKVTASPVTTSTMASTGTSPAGSNSAKTSSSNLPPDWVAMKDGKKTLYFNKVTKECRNDPPPSAAGTPTNAVDDAYKNWVEVKEGKKKFYFNKITKECRNSLPDISEIENSPNANATVNAPVYKTPSPVKRTKSSSLTMQQSALRSPGSTAYLYGNDENWWKLRRKESSTVLKSNNWEMYIDSETNFPFYYNHSTKETQWEVPSEWASETGASTNSNINVDVEPDTDTNVEQHATATPEWKKRKHQSSKLFKAENWEMYFDSDANAPFYYNTSTQESRWEPPADWNAVTSKGNIVITSPTPSESESNFLNSPNQVGMQSGQTDAQAIYDDNWVSYFDEETKTNYYYNTVTQESQWELPEVYANAE